MHKPAVNVRMGRYLLLELIAAGGMAEIYLARHVGIAGFRKLIVVKRIHQHLALDPKFVEMFFDEARIAARLNHPNIVQIFDLGKVEGFPFIAMEYVQGCSVRDVLSRASQRGQPMPWPLVAWLGARICEGLAHAHDLADERGRPVDLVHRDISPHNLLVSFDGMVKIVDFGIARANNRIEQTQSYSRKGKLRYMSPEQTMGMPLDRRSDLFSLGIVLWELLANTRLFDADGELGVMQQITSGSVPSPVAYDAAVPQGMVAAIKRVLALEPEDRFATAAELGEALEEVLAAEERPPTAKRLAEYLEQLFGDEVQQSRADVTRLLALEVDELERELAREASEQESPSRGAKAASTTPRSLKTFLWSFAGALLAAGLALALAFSGVLDEASTDPPTFKDEQPGSGAPPPRVASTAPPKAAASSGRAAPEPKEKAARKVETRPAKRKTATLTLASEPPGATVRVDGRVLPQKTPVSSLTLAAGRHVIEIEKEGFVDYRRSLHIAAGTKRKLDVPLEAKPAPLGYLTLNTMPWSVVYFQGRKLGETPLVNVKLPPGSHELEVLPKGEPPKRRVKVIIRSGKLTRQTIDL